jgi:hypothetical protein
LYHTLACGPIVTSPMIRAPGAMNAVSSIRGAFPSNGRIVAHG